eukprot:TRINITY_DN2309_c0_g2_i2.p1 TRINITY_DN2309_c0_g2~~TRINITY_DN2309_c0_g2_i2.p1  ORF type:complete len:175 (-),score=20.03 TRINITY_DN2309_c0_g2_i2:57-581(-)
MSSEELPIEFGTVTEKNLGSLRVLNLALFPVQYREQFYHDLLLPSKNDLARLAFYNDVLVGAVVCRIENKEGNDIARLPAGSQNQGVKIYIMTLGVLAPYRIGGIGRRLLLFILENIPKKFPHVEEIYLHVQVNNDGAIKFYEKFGFKISETIKDYYKRIDPPDCYVLVKHLKQ